MKPYDVPFWQFPVLPILILLGLSLPWVFSCTTEPDYRPQGRATVVAGVDTVGTWEGRLIEGPSYVEVESCAGDERTRLYGTVVVEYEEVCR